MLPYIRNEESLFHFYLLFLLLSASPEEMCEGGGGGGAVIPCTFIPGYFSILSVFFCLFFSYSSQPAPRVRERYGFSAVPKFTLTLLYIYFYVSLTFEYYSNRNSLLAKVA